MFIKVKYIPSSTNFKLSYLCESSHETENHNNNNDNSWWCWAVMMMVQSKMLRLNRPKSLILQTEPFISRRWNHRPLTDRWI